MAKLRIAVLFGLGAILCCATAATADEISEFWRWFEANSSSYHALNFENTERRDELFADLGERLEKIDENIAFEFGKLDNDLMDFVISASGIVETFPVVKKLVDAAPQIPNWKFTAFRQRKDEVVTIEMGGINIDRNTTLAKLYKDDGKIGIVLFLPGYEETPNQTFEQIGFLLLDQTLGEYVVGTQVGFVEFEKKSDAIEGAMRLSDIVEFFEL